MTIVIVKNGKKKADQQWAGRCSACGAEATCKTTDLKNISYEGVKDMEHAWTQCPECGVGSNGYGGLLMYKIK